jgi:hypothetical protein
MSTDQTDRMRAVADALTRAGWPAFVEYPGYIEAGAENLSIAIGPNLEGRNEWNAQYRREGNELGGWTIVDPPDDVEALAGLLYRSLMTAKVEE